MKPKSICFLLVASWSVIVATAHAAEPTAARCPRLFFTSQGKTALINADGSGLKYFQFSKR